MTTLWQMGTRGRRLLNANSLWGALRAAFQNRPETSSPVVPPGGSTLQKEPLTRQELEKLTDDIACSLEQFHLRLKELEYQQAVTRKELHALLQLLGCSYDEIRPFLWDDTYDC